MKMTKGFITFLLMCVFTACQPQSIDGGKAVVLNDENFEEKVLGSKDAFLVDFYADWCPPCKIQGPIIEELAEKFEGRMSVGKVDVDNNRALSAEYGIRSIPTLIIFENGKQVEKMVGLQRKSGLILKMNKYASLSGVSIAKSKGVLLLTDSIFDKYVLDQEGLVLVNFYSNQAEFYKKQRPIIEEIEYLYAGKMTVAKVNVDKSEDLSFKYVVSETPTLIMFRNGKVIERMVGLHSQEKLEKKIKEHLK